MLSAAFLSTAFFARADTIDELRAKIEERNAAIAELEKEIAGYQAELEKTGKETATLRSVVRTIALEQKKLTADIRITENRIAAAGLAIEELSKNIGSKEERIARSVSAMSRALRAIDRAESASLLETLLQYDSLSELWDGVEMLERFEAQVRAETEKVKELKQNLEEQRTKTEQKKRELTALRRELSDRKQILEISKQNKNKLLAATKNKESEYKKILAKKFALRDAFERELLEFESQLRYEIDPSQLPETGAGVLRSPLDTIKITQKFGNTAFARSGAYQGKGHNGIDLRAPTGTRVKAALGGAIVGVGNTDMVCPGASYGKWVLLEHGNGLSTLYAHLSLISVAEGQSVESGETIGYSGETGYATGPHLHFTVYATQGVRIMNRKSRVCGGTYRMPVADLKAYLNPLSYL